ncbi:MAG: YwqG family protein [Ruminococcus flavefaciens]|nr:YwqG family protein [Ruminococcus flavefaciens]
MTVEQARQYTEIAVKKTIDELGKQYAVNFRLKEKTSSVFASKIGGIPYFPLGAEIPLDGYGNQLRFLMQINCSDVKGIECFPANGIIQFWISSDDCWGMCSKGGYRVLYYGDISEDVEVPPITEWDDSDREFFPLKDEFGIEFMPVTEDTPTDFFVYRRTFCKYFNEISGENIESPYELEYRLKMPGEILEILYENNSTYGHKIGGSSDFCQYDPRESEAEQERYDFQLLQMESDFGTDGENIMWGGAGICHFFINSEKLRNCDFSDILYYCDCC